MVCVRFEVNRLEHSSATDRWRNFRQRCQGLLRPNYPCSHFNLRSQLGMPVAAFTTRTQIADNIHAVQDAGRESPIRPTLQRRIPALRGRTGALGGLLQHGTSSSTLIISLMPKRQTDIQFSRPATNPDHQADNGRIC
jgi:hypothetical protein